MRAAVAAAVAACLVAAGGAAYAAEWYDDYWNGVEAVQAQRYDVAIDLLTSAIRSGPRPNPRARIYGVRTIEFYPHYWLGKAYQGKGDARRARQSFELSVRHEELEGDEARIRDRATFLRAPPTPPPPPDPVERDVRGVRVVADGSLEGALGGGTINLGTYHALLIGIQSYASEAFEDLRTPIRDIARLGELLVQHYGFSGGNVRYLTNERATRQGIIDRMIEYRETLDSGDNLLVYYAGHGRQEPGTDDGFWIPYGATRAESSWLSNEELKRIIKNVRAKHTLLISDSCFAGTLHRGSDIEVPLVDRYLSQVHRLDSYQVITSGGLEPVTDGGRDGMSLFAYLLNKFIEEPPNTYFTAGELGVHLEKTVSNASPSRQTPQHGPIPESFDRRGQFVFFRVR